MDEGGKRSFDSVDPLNVPPAKRPLQELSEDGPMTQLDVVYFKKEAIWRQMKVYKLQVSELNRELSRYEKRHQAFVAAHLLLESWFVLVMGACGESIPRKLELAAPESEYQDVLDERRRKLVGLLKNVAPSMSDDTVSKFFDTVKLEAEKQAVEHSNDELRQKITTLEEDVLNLQKEQDRRESATLKRILLNSQVKQEEPAEQPNGTTNGSPHQVKPEESAISSAEKDELEKLRLEVTELKAGFKLLEQRLGDARDSFARADQLNQELKERLADLSDADLAKSTRHMALVDKTNMLSENLALVTKLRDELVLKVKDLEDKENHFMDRINKDLEEENAHLKDTLSKAEQNLVRIRTARDELLGKQAVLKLELENKKTNEEVNKLNQILEERLRNLEGSRQNEYSKNGIDFDLLEKPDLIKRLQVLTQEVKDIESAFQETRGLAIDRMKETIDRESLVKKLSVEKTKADQKYFASMRLKDLLVAENKVLKSQISKSQELVSKLADLEKNYVSKIEILTKSFDDLRVIKESSIQENSKLQEAIKQLTRTREVLGKEVSQLKDDLARVRKERADLANELGNKKTAEAKLEAKLRSTESLLQKYKLNNTSLLLQEDEKQLEALRSITKCSVCSKHWKNTAITVCGHVFCDGCVQERLAARLRRCPTCNKGFSSNDLLSIHL